MNPVLVDANVLLDVITDDPAWGDWSAHTLQQTANEAVLAINPLIYAEVSVGLDRIEDLERALPRPLYVRVGLPYEAAFLAGKCFLRYRRRGGTRRSPLPGFYIGAHAAVAGYRLLTRDAKRYREVFPHVELISPSWNPRPEGPPKPGTQTRHTCGAPQSPETQGRHPLLKIAYTRNEARAPPVAPCRSKLLL